MQQRLLFCAILAVTCTNVFVANAFAQRRETIDVTRVDNGRTIKFKPELFWPEGAGPFGIVIVVNSSAGAQDIFLAVTAAPMNKAGIAIAVLDTFSPRAVASTGVDQTQVSSTQMALDAFQVAQSLRSHPRIKGDKIAVQGHSKGGVMAMHAATAGFRDFAGVTYRAFDAAIAFSPSCEFQFRDPKLASPLLAMLAEKDDATVPGPCLKYFERMKANNQRITWEVVPKTWHSWSTTGTHFEANLYSARKCADEPLYYTRSGFESSKDGRIIPFAQIHTHCEARGYRIGGPGDKRAYVLNTAAAWLKTQGW